MPRRLAGMPKLLENTIHRGLRARRRRVLTAAHEGKSLAALAVCDEQLDQSVRSAAIQYHDAVALLERLLAEPAPAALDELCFLRLALAIQSNDPDWFGLVRQFLPKAPSAVRDALWFFPASADVFPQVAPHVGELFRHARQHPELQRLALELVGRTDARSLAPEVAQLLHHTDLPDIRALAHWTLSCLGQPLDSTRQFVAEGLRSDDRRQQADALTVVRVAPHLAADDLLQRYLEVNEPSWAWPVLLARAPRRTCDRLLQHDDLAPADRLRVLAIAGYLDGIVDALARMAQDEGPVTPEQADLLLVTLGEVPVEARCRPSDAEAKARALRNALLGLCRRWHVGLTNDADRCEWSVHQLFSDPAKARSLRFRDGHALPNGVPRLSPVMLQLTHPMRQWLYIERASLGRHALSLDALDVTRRQVSALSVAEFADDMLAAQ